MATPLIHNVRPTELTIEHEIIEQIEEERLGRTMQWVCSFVKSLGHVNPFATVSEMWRAGYVLLADRDGAPLPRWRCEQILRDCETHDDARLLATDKGVKWVHGSSR